MKKRSELIILTLAGLGIFQTACQAEILPAHGLGQIGYRAEILCDSLTVRKEASADSEAVKTLHYGDFLLVDMNQSNGWVICYFGDDVDGGPEGWVNTEYIIIDPSWYRTDDTTPVYAWNDTSALKVALLDKGTTLPILKDEGDWLIVSLRGAAGWIHKNDAERAGAASNSEESTSGTASDGQSQSTSEQAGWFTVYAEDGSTADIRPTEGAMYEDAKGRTYSNIRGDMYYCIETDITYSSDPNVWIYGEPTPDDELTGEDYGENQDYGDEWTGEDFGENQGDVPELTVDDDDEN